MSQTHVKALKQEKKRINEIARNPGISTKDARVLFAKLSEYTRAILMAEGKNPKLFGYSIDNNGTRPAIRKIKGV